jgi:prephenate dehydrogenase
MAKTRVTLVGLGRTGMLIGSAVKKAFPDFEVAGHDRDRDVAQRAIKEKAIDKEEWNLPRACEGAALVIIAIPRDGLEVTLQSVASEASSGSIVCVVGDANKQALALGSKLLPADVAIVASTLALHPEPNGGVATLDKAVWTVAARGEEGQVAGFAGFVNELGARAVFSDATERDGMSLAVEAIPAAVQAMLMLSVSSDEAWRERRWAAGAKFAEATVLPGDGEALSEALLNDRMSSIHWLNQVMLQCMALRDAISDNDAKAVTKQLADASERREAWLAAWRKGRELGAEPVNVPRNAVLSMLVGQRNADRFNRQKK